MRLIKGDLPINLTEECRQQTQRWLHGVERWGGGVCAKCPVLDKTPTAREPCVIVAACGG